MRALSLTQPWATLIAIGAKRIETRSWSLDYRGRIAIHASKSLPSWARDFATFYDPANTLLKEAGILLPAMLPRGAVVAVAEMTACVPVEDITRMSQGLLPHEIEFGDYSPDQGRFAFVLQNVVRLSTPIPARGSLGLWTLLPKTYAAVREQLG